jgi:pimeloyl-ACP methyl ester carboxylesterase
MSTWILLRGLTREQGHWGAFVPTLMAALPSGSQLLTPDLPGNGLLHAQTSPTRVEDMVEALRATLISQGHRPPYNVVAMSLGAMVTVAWAHAHPEELTRCVLINTSLRPFSPFWHRLQARNYPRIFKLLLTRAGAEAWERAIMAMTTRHPANPQATLQNWLQLRAQHPVSTANGLRQLWAATRYRAPQAKPPVPMLILNALGDRLVHPSCSAALAQRWQVPLLRHPTAGHDLPLDAAPWAAQQIQAWLATPASQPEHQSMAPANPTP